MHFNGSFIQKFDFLFLLNTCMKHTSTHVRLNLFPQLVEETCYCESKEFLVEYVMLNYLNNRSYEVNKGENCVIDTIEPDLWFKLGAMQV